MVNQSLKLLKLTFIAPEKLMVGRLSAFLLGLAYFSAANFEFWGGYLQD